MPYSKDPGAYPPELLELFRRGYEKPLEIKLDTPASATSLRHRLHAYRRALQHSNSPYSSLASSCVVRVEGPKLIIQPSTLEIRQALEAAGVPFNPNLAAEQLSSEMDTADEALERVLRDQGFGKDI